MDNHRTGFGNKMALRCSWDDAKISLGSYQNVASPERNWIGIGDGFRRHWCITGAASRGKMPAGGRFCKQMEGFV